MNTLPSNEDGIVNIEMSSPVLANVYTLIYETAALNPNASGEITKANVQTALNTQSSSTEAFMYVMNVSYNGYPCKFTRHNDWYEIENNSFKRGSTTTPRYRQLATKFVITPANTSASVKFTLLKYPKAVNLATAVTSELPDQTHKTIVELAVQLASTAIRDTELAQLNQPNQ